MSICPNISDVDLDHLDGCVCQISSLEGEDVFYENYLEIREIRFYPL